MGQLTWIAGCGGGAFLGTAQLSEPYLVPTVRVVFLLKNYEYIHINITTHSSL